MKGIIFIQFTKKVNEVWGEDMVEDLIEQADLDSEGVYTSVGTYCFREMVSLINVLSKISGTSPADLQKTFGEYLFKQLSMKYPLFLEGKKDLFSFLASLENTIHVEVKKLYPEAELPSFEYVFPAENIMEMTYRSQRPFADLAEGLLRGAVAHFGEKIELSRQDFPVEKGSKALFRLTK
ncbi:guanylate cyclase [Terasakiella brassicae]|uniref:Guanylate cyclase n=1 Tax=Terasakiella brassicae TaxID=1634917 RepID=A0A917F6B3_9PROT|nr:heme NO-binding domain-containing protein [Terasakiella brassicae]GGF55365.1 guanylate cyclase [Terasakiella brassicae]